MFKNGKYRNLFLNFVTIYVEAGNCVQWDYYPLNRLISRRISLPKTNNPELQKMHSKMILSFRFVLTITYLKK